MKKSDWRHGLLHLHLQCSWRRRIICKIYVSKIVVIALADTGQNTYSVIRLIRLCCIFNRTFLTSLQSQFFFIYYSTFWCFFLYCVLVSFGNFLLYPYHCSKIFKDFNWFCYRCNLSNLQSLARFLYYET